MSWEMQIRKEKGFREEDDVWESLKPSVTPLVAPYGYSYKRDAVEMLDKLFPNLSPSEKRVVEVK